MIENHRKKVYKFRKISNFALFLADESFRMSFHQSKLRVSTFETSIFSLQHKSNRAREAEKRKFSPFSRIHRSNMTHKNCAPKKSCISWKHKIPYFLAYHVWKILLCRFHRHSQQENIVGFVEEKFATGKQQKKVDQINRAEKRKSRYLNYALRLFVILLRAKLDISALGYFWKANLETMNVDERRYESLMWSRKRAEPSAAAVLR